MLPTAAFVVIAVPVLFFAPIHGVAENGDFWRVMVPAGIRYQEPPSEIQYKYVERTYAMVPANPFETTTSAVVPALIARVTAGFLGDTFDLRLVGAIYFLVFVTGLFFFLRAIQSWIVSLGVLWLALEPNVFLHFNSFFSVAVYLALWPWLLWSLLESLKALKLGKHPQRMHSVVLTLSCLFIVTSKTQFILVPVFALLLFGLFSPKKFFSAGKLLIIPIVAGIAWTFLYPSGIRKMNDYQAVFTGIVTVADNPKDALNALGIDPDYHEWNGRSMPPQLFRGTLPKELKDELDSLSRTRLLKLYFTEAGALKNSVPKIAEALSRWPMGYLGHYEKSTGMERKEFVFPFQFSSVRDPILQKNSWIVWGILLFGLAAFVIYFRDPVVALTGFLALQILSQFGIVILADGFGAIHRHFIVNRLSFDLLFWLLLALGYAKLSGFIRRKKIF